ncbi:protein CDKN2AIP homolog A [Oncorhynchus mykiss]|uniref:CDKN2A interacting protein n=1 Tax=Oncorhynchus mykiss TaxID=8022 RepID=A0A8C7TLD7_ONCMY|nr:protein CDKN2AIP homolog A-like [Oncorhynchus mykiss]XP_036819811.1 protein CDKN2AIP homolog A-like [Oncorhynchus mykiss]XP_036837027.1 protein CDKN2AIP homolog A [Oncorhynchus mykiss]XP_036837028.1 protein CDKN2AIP homolog A [Oncorhynchus mykiss]
MAEGRSGEDIVSEYLDQNPHLVEWVESLRGGHETNKQWHARREFFLRNMETFPTVQPGFPSPSLDRLLSLSICWANHIFLGCRYPQPVMDRIKEMAEGVVVNDAPVRKTRDEILGKGKRTAGGDDDSCAKRTKPGNPFKQGPPPQAPAEHQPFFNRLYKAVAWKLVSAGGFGPNLDHFEILRACTESSKESLSCVFVPLKDIPDLPAARSQKEGQVCELRCQTVYLGTGYGRDEAAARAMASKEALKAFQGRKVMVKICRRRFNGRDVEDLVLLDDQPRNPGFPPAISYPFQPEQQGDGPS